MLQGTGWSDKNRSWQIDYLLENGAPRWCSEMWRGVCLSPGAGVGWSERNEEMELLLEQSFCHLCVS